MRALFARLALLALCAARCRALSFQLGPRARRCLKEELRRDVMVTGEYEVSGATGAAPGARTDLRVTDSSGRLLYSRDDARKGKRTFVTEDSETYEICFESRGRPGADPARAAPGSPASPLNSSSPSGLPGNFRTPAALVHLSIKRGVEARNYEDIAKAEKLKPLEADLRRLRDLSDSIVKAFASVKQWKEEGGGRNGSVGACVVVFSIHLAFWLVFCLGWFLKAKKLKE